MNQKEYELIGRVFQRHRQTYGGRTDSVAKELIEDMAQALADEYPNFNRDMFIESTKTSQERPEELASALKMANGGYAVAVLVKDYGSNYFAWVYEPQRGEFTKAGALQRAQDIINAGTKGYLNDNWTAYTNAPGILDWFKQEEFVITV